MVLGPGEREGEETGGGLGSKAVGLTDETVVLA